ncbi:MAG: hypothetical protein J7518_07340 [Nocardioidaceae bacterium]|nr:hypothetical protein [Nocardioidaceae bacterium]
MVVAMLLGMATLYPVWRLLTSGDRGDWTRILEVDLLAMATAMTVPMVLWMLRRGHRMRPIVEMALAMYAGFVVLFPFLWGGMLGEMGVMMTGHVLMPLFMLGAMVARYREYAHAH